MNNFRRIRSLFKLHGSIMSGNYELGEGYKPSSEWIERFCLRAFWFWLNPNHQYDTAPWDCSRTKNKL